MTSAHYTPHGGKAEQISPLPARDTQHIPSSTDRDKIVRDEITRLEKEFGPTAPHLTKSDFLDGLQHITPLSLSVLRRIYAPDGPWGKILRQYFIPVPRFDPRRYLVSVFGRPYINKDLEDSILAAGGIRRYFGTLRMYMEMYYLYRKNTRVATNTSQRDKTTAQILHRILEHTAPLLFRIALYQKTCADYLRSHLHGHVAEDEWLSLVTPVASDSTPPNLSCRTLEEFELSVPRWGEDPRILARMQARVARAPSATDSARIRDLRETTIDRIQSIWERQKLSLFFSLYDFFSRMREEAHSALLMDLYELRRALLTIDHDARWHNTVWYADIETVLERPDSLSFTRLRKAQQAHETMREIAPPEEIKDVQWDDMVHEEPAHNPTRRTQSPDTSYAGVPLSPGHASGVTGTMQDLENGTVVDILVTENLDPSLTVFFGSIKGIVCERGGELSHVAIVAREYGIPILRMLDAVATIPSGTTITLDTTEKSARTI
ncbi:hypothetical protein HY416_02105 [Candidatus Kaiserbacteria bacterium]|nr:hypothetical protein [Candidatus Kaiserbacteria bacterium]